MLEIKCLILKKRRKNMIELIDLDFKKSDLEPFISEKTVEFHYGKHHKGYVDKTNELIRGTEFFDMNLEEIIEAVYGNEDLRVLYNNAGQVYNHNVYWKSMGIGKKFSEEFRKEIIDTFGSMEDFRNKLISEGVNLFGSGWVWCVRNKNGKLEVMTTKNGDTPLVLGMEVIFNIDVWEHAYYLDYQNLRKKYLEELIINLLKI